MTMLLALLNMCRVNENSYLHTYEAQGMFTTSMYLAPHLTK